MGRIRSVGTILIIMLFAFGCVADRSLRSDRSEEDEFRDGLGKDGETCKPGSQCAISDDGNLDNDGDGEDDPFVNGAPEIRHLVDPFDGTYSTKVTIPKNYTGYLYLSGININSLRDKLVTVRFMFGRNLEPIEIPATVGRAPGITPQTDIEVLIMNAYDRPFENLRLVYDLYDYNDYDEDNDHVEEKEPTTDPRDRGLYCRGLKLEHDPTFQETSGDGVCDNYRNGDTSTIVQETCRYAYAKIEDSGLVNGNTVIKPSAPQVDLGGGDSYHTDSANNQLKKCLPDNIDLANFKAVMGEAADSLTSGPDFGATSVTFDGTDYTYYGPYRTFATEDWEIKYNSPAVYSDVSAEITAGSGNYYEPTGIFQKSMDTNCATSPTTCDPGKGYRSFLFPRAGKMDLKANVQHFSSTDAFGASPNFTRSVTSYSTAQETQFMDGCNLRATNYDDVINEGISSCNVTATVQLFTNDRDTGAEIILAETNDVKVQITRASLTDYTGREVLNSSMKACENSQSCGSEECCYNNRCWGKDLVSQCKEDVTDSDYRGIGEACTSDYQCSSLCCDQTFGTCQVHEYKPGEDPVYCSKAPGQTCVARQWCRKENLSVCRIVRTSLDPQGIELCSLRCYNVPTHGQCRNGLCIPPTQEDPPTYDPTKPECSNYDEYYLPEELESLLNT